MKEVNSIIKSFVRHQKGSVSIEFLLTVIVLFFILFFMIDLAMLRSNLGKLDNASYSLVNILRERTQLHSGKIHNLDEELNDFKKLAKKLVYGDKNSDKELYLVLESLSFQQTSLKSNPLKIYKSAGDKSKCSPFRDLSTLAEISPRSEAKSGRKLPLYQLTICVPSYSIFKAITSNESSSTGRILRSSSVTLIR